MKRDLSPLAKYPVLVTCHRRFEMGLDQGSDKFEALFAFAPARRKAVLIDESLELVYMATVPSGELRRLLGELPPRYNVPHADALDVLDNLLKVMRRHSGAARRLTADQLLVGTGFTPAQASGVVAQLWRAVSSDTRLDAQVRLGFDPVLYAVLHQLDEDQYRWQFTNRTSKEESLNGHRLLSIPRGTRAIIFDATARLNFVYQSRPREFGMVDIARAKSWDHVEVLVARGGLTGKSPPSSRPPLADALPSHSLAQHAARARPAPPASTSASWPVLRASRTAAPPAAAGPK